jgi:hypothetical protein
MHNYMRVGSRIGSNSLNVPSLFYLTITGCHLPLTPLRINVVHSTYRQNAPQSGGRK